MAEHDAESDVRTASCGKLLQMEVSPMPKNVKRFSNNIMLKVKGHA
jgi:hypothetical protein